MKGLKKQESSDQNKQQQQQQSINLKKSASQKIENNKTSGSLKTGEFQSQHSEASLPDSSRNRRDGRKRMKKTISNKVYENMQSQDVSKVDDSNLQQINIDTSLNKDNNTHYNNAIDFMSLNGLSEQTMHNEHTQPAQTFVGGAFKMQSSQQAVYYSGMQNQQKNSNLSIQQQLDQQNQGQTQNQGISQAYASADGAQMPRRLDNRNTQIIELSQNQSDVPKLSLKQKLCRGIIGIIFIAYLSFNVYMTFQQGSPESGQLRGRGSDDGKADNSDELYPHAKEEMRKEAEDLRIFSKEIESCLLSRQEFVKLYRKKEFFFDVSTCEWVYTCDTKNKKIYSNFCVLECPATYKDIQGTCLGTNQKANTLIQCPENSYQQGFERQMSGDQQIISCLLCPDNCFSCNSSSVCQICKKGFFLQKGICVDECSSESNKQIVEDMQTQTCLLNDNSKLKYSTFYTNSKILQKRIYYQTIYSAERLQLKRNITYLYFINDRINPINQIQENFDKFQKYVEDFDNLIVVSLPSVPDALLRDPHFYNFFNSELIPQVENRYQTPLSASFRVIGGEGYGGFQALYIALNSHPLYEFGFIGLINSFVSVKDLDQSQAKQLFFQDEKIQEVTFTFNTNSNMVIYSDYTGYQENSKVEQSFQSLVSAFKESNPNSDIFTRPQSDCSGIQRQTCFGNRYLNFFEDLKSYNSKIKENNI